jgi:hypothetical protein
MKIISLLKYIISIVAFVLISINSFGQVKTKIYDNGIPSNLLPIKSGLVNELMVKAPVGLDNLLKDSKIDSAVIEYGNSFALPKPVNINFLSTSKMIEDKGTLIYYLTINAL